MSDKSFRQTARDQTAQYADSIDTAVKYLFAFFAVPIAVTWQVISGFCFEIYKRVPGRKGIQARLIKFGYSGLYTGKNTHLICNTIYPDGEVVPQPAKVDKERGHIETSNGETFTYGSERPKPHFIGDARVVWAVADVPAQVEPVSARIADAMDMSDDRWQTVQHTPNGIEPVAVQNPNTPGGGAPTQPVPATDGGLIQRDVTVVKNAIDALAEDPPEGEEPYSIEEITASLHRYFRDRFDDVGGQIKELRPSSWFDDVWLDVDVREDYDGALISFEKANETLLNKIDIEELEDQEWRGRRAEQERGGTSDFLKGALIGGGLVLACLFILVFFGGGEGSPGGSINPLMLVPFWGL